MGLPLLQVQRSQRAVLTALRRSFWPPCDENAEGTEKLSLEKSTRSDLSNGLQKKQEIAMF
jgi:hypothetical protein